MSDSPHPKLVAKTIKRVCYACPASWAGELEDGRQYRIRYRWGELLFMVDKDPSRLSIFSSAHPEVRHTQQIGDPFHGHAELEDVAPKLIDFIDLSKAEVLPED